ncbi:neural cell adhesion molecule L1-like isoform X1 [Lates japonicus]|uniref:Neural cell adhesion molecule L1-like isoform X1 n=1 Tax=Lates japonicus TaxID=270547 RepID=A0AAD3NMY5_LATJO|nr:neural cell adhesion molecule L1-like isoform X1 [Lates japonicus]
MKDICVKESIVERKRNSLMFLQTDEPWGGEDGVKGGMYSFIFLPHPSSSQSCILSPYTSSQLEPSQAAIHIPSNYHISDLKRPPVITTQPESVTVFSVEDLVMSCEASGNPPPIFRWTKDGEEFNPSSDPELKVTEDTGSFAFYTLSNTMDTLKQYQGKYVCYASNELGTAVSNEAILTTDAPPTQRKKRRAGRAHHHYPVLMQLTLRCGCQHMAQESSASSLALIRVNLLTSRGLEISNVTHDDEGSYTCFVQNTQQLVYHCRLGSPQQDSDPVYAYPEALKVQPGNTAIFTCLAQVDPNSDLNSFCGEEQSKLFESETDQLN